MSDENRLLYLRVALIAFGLTFIFGIYVLGIVWPSGWTWGHGHSHYLLMIIGVYATLGVFLLMASRDPYTQHHLVYRVVERGSRRDHDRSVVQRCGRTRPLDRGCARAVHRGDRSCGIDAPEGAGMNTACSA